MIPTLPKPFSPTGIIRKTGQLVWLHIISCPQSYATIEVQCQQPIWETNIESASFPGVVEVVPANGSKSVALDTEVSDKTDFFGGFSIYYNTEDGSQQKYNSPLFHVSQDTGETSPMTYNQQALSTSLVASGTASTSQATPTKASTSNSATTSALTSTAKSNPSSQGPHLAAKIGLGIGIMFAVAAMGLIGFLYGRKKERKKNSVPRNSFGMSQRPAKVVNQGPITGELDGHQRNLELPVGPLDAELEGSRPALQDRFL